MSTHVEFYWDPVSPYVYLACTQLARFIQETRIHLTPRPVLFAGLLEANRQLGPAEIPAKRRYVFTDALRWAAHYQVPLLGPPLHPFNPLLALRSSLALDDPREAMTWVNTLLCACWAEQQDISDPQVVLDLARRAGLPGEEMLQKAQTPEIKAQLKANTEQAIQRGVFGVPSFWVEGEIFWGNDRLNFLRDYLAGKNKVDPARLQNMLSQAPGVQRKTR